MNENVVQTCAVDAPASTPNQLIALALERGADPATLEKLMDLQDRWESGQARKAYVAAMAGFKQEAPSVLLKDSTVDFTTAKGRTHYNYANLGGIVQAISALMGKYDLHASWETHQDDKGNVGVTCHITHAAGHRESVSLKGPRDESGNKNSIQAVGSTVTYLQRYTLLSVLGLATDEDDDGKGGKPAKPPIRQPKAKPTTEPTTVQGVIEEVEVFDGTTKAGKPYTKWGVTIGGVVYGTFSEAIGQLAADSVHLEAIISYKVEGNFNTIIELAPVDQPE